MEVAVIDERRKPLWEDFVRENRNAIAWQSYEWNDILKRHYRCEYYPIAALEAGKVVGILPLYHIRTYLSGDALISVPFAVAGGMVSDRVEVRNLLLKKAIDMSKSHGSCRITLKQYKIRMEEDFRTDDNYYNRELSLDRDPGKVWAQFSDRNREMIERTEKDWMELEHPCESVVPYFKLLLQYLHAKGIPCVSRRWIEDLLRFKMYTIAILRKNGDIVAGTLVKEFKKTVSFPFSCVLRESMADASFAFRLYWELLQRYSTGGFEIFHSGRIPNNDATNEHRLGWGGTKYGYYYQYYPKENVKTEFTTKRGKKRELMEKSWKILPQGVVNVLGPIVVRQFP